MYTQALGEGCLLMETDAPPEPNLSRRLALLANHLRALDTVFDAVPGYTSLAVYFDQSRTDATAIEAELSATVDLLPDDPTPGKHHRIPVRYTGDDLDELAEHLGLSPEELVTRHSAPDYTVAMIGFRPHFPYLLGLDPRLACPRRDRPRSRITAGAVAIGGEQTGIYPDVSPGGWHIIGFTDPAYCRRLSPGDTLRFEANS